MTTESDSPPAPPRVFVCVACGADVPLLVRDYGKGNVRLAICARCNAVADPYVEYDHILLFLEALLLKPQVYRHVLYNLQAPPQPRTLLKLFVILSLLDMNVKAYLIDRRRGVAFRAESSLYQTDLLKQETAISGLRVSQYSLHLVCVSLLENAVLVATILALIWLDPFRRGWRHYLSTHAVAVDKAAGSSVWGRQALVRYGTAMCISSFGKMFAMLTVIWEFHWTFVHVIGAIVVCSNALALQLLLGEQQAYAPAVLALVAAGFGMRFLTQVAMYALGNPTLFYVFA